MVLSTCGVTTIAGAATRHVTAASRRRASYIQRIPTTRMAMVATNLEEATGMAEQ